MNNLRFVSLFILYACEKNSNACSTSSVQVYSKENPYLEREIVKFASLLFSNSKDSVNNTIGKKYLSTMTDNPDVIRLKKMFSSLFEKHNMYSSLICDSISIKNNEYTYYGIYSVDRHFFRINGKMSITGCFTQNRDFS